MTTQPQPTTCPHCGQPMPASTPAADPAPAKVAPPQKTNETWHDRPPLL